MTENTTTGGCFCGEVSFEFSVEPDRRVQCFCRTCQYFSQGGPHSFVIVPAQSFKAKLESGQDFKTFTYRGDSGNTVTKNFCPKCCTAVFSEVEDESSIAISLGALNDPSKYSPAASIWTGSAPSWASVNPDIPKFS